MISFQADMPLPQRSQACSMKRLLPLSFKTAQAVPFDGMISELVLTGTRQYLLSTTMSLAKISNAADRYFSRLGAILAVERAMRDFVRLTSVFLPCGMSFGQPQLGSSLLLAPPQPTFLRVIPNARNNLSLWDLPYAVPLRSRGAKSEWPDFTPLLVLPAAMIAAMPSFDSWMPL